MKLERMKLERSTEVGKLLLTSEYFQQTDRIVSNSKRGCVFPIPGYSIPHKLCDITFDFELSNFGQSIPTAEKLSNFSLLPTALSNFACPHKITQEDNIHCNIQLLIISYL